MPGSLRPIAPGLCALALSACASVPPQPPQPRPTGTGRVEVTVTGFKNDEGQVMVALYLDERGWPGDEKLAFGAVVLPIREGQAVAEFGDVPAGPFAVSVFHDENLDRKLDTGVFGIPSEDYGFSRDARSTFGPAGFEAARLDMAAGESQQITIKVH